MNCPKDKQTDTLSQLFRHRLGISLNQFLHIITITFGNNSFGTRSSFRITRLDKIKLKQPRAQKTTFVQIVNNSDVSQIYILTQSFGLESLHAPTIMIFRFHLTKLQHFLWLDQPVIFLILTLQPTKVHRHAIL